MVGSGLLRVRSRSRSTSPRSATLLFILHKTGKRVWHIKESGFETVQQQQQTMSEQQQQQQAKGEQQHTKGEQQQQQETIGEQQQ